MPITPTLILHVHPSLQCAHHLFAFMNSVVHLWHLRLLPFPSSFVSYSYYTNLQVYVQGWTSPILHVPLGFLTIARNLHDNAFAFFKVGALMMASIFPGSTAMPSLLTICPRRVSLITQNAHLGGFRLSRVARQCSWHQRRWCRWSFGAPYTVKSSKNTSMNVKMYSPNTSEMIP